MAAIPGASHSSAQLPPQQEQSPSISAQLNKMLVSGSSLPTIQGLRNILGNPIQEALMQLGNLGQQQNQQSIQDQIWQHQQQNQARLEDQLRQQQQQQQQHHSQLEEQLRQNLLNRAAANPGLMAALPPNLQQQLLVHSLSRIASSSAPAPDP